MSEELDFYLKERKSLLKERDRQNKLWSTNTENINRIALEKLITFGLYREQWNLVHNNEYFVYSERRERLYLQYGEIQKNITAYVKSLSIGSVEYLPLENNVTLRCPSSGGGMPWIQFTIGVDIKDFIRRNKLKVCDGALENKIKELQRLQEEFQV